MTQATVQFVTFRHILKCSTWTAQTQKHNKLQQTSYQYFNVNYTTHLELLKYVSKLIQKENYYTHNLNTEL